MRVCIRIIYSLGLSVLLFQMVIGGSGLSWAQQSSWTPQLSPQGQPSFSDGTNVTPPVSVGPQQPTRSQTGPSGEARLGFSGEVAAPVPRQCAAEMSWPLVPIPQVLVATPPAQVPTIQTQPFQTQPLEGVGSISAQDL